MIIPVLMYHDIRPDDFNIISSFSSNRPYIQKASHFKEQIDSLINNEINTIKISELKRTQNNKKNIVLTFDDGDESNYTQAYKQLMKNGMYATFFITTDFIGQRNRVSWEQLKEMLNYGMEIGSHTVSHPFPTQLNDEQFIFELKESKRILEDGLNTEITSFSMPTGFYNSKIKKLAKEVGYSFVCTSHAGYFDTSNPDYYNIKRIAIKRSTHISTFQKFSKCNKKIIINRIIEKKIRDSGKFFLSEKQYNNLRDKLLNLFYFNRNK